MEYSIKQVRRIFSCPDNPLTEELLLKLVNSGDLPPGRKVGRSIVWNERDLPQIGMKVGFLAKPKSPKVVSVFVTKGGALKTTLTLTLARVAALHNIHTLVIGLDLQGDISRTLRPSSGIDNEDESLAQSLQNELRVKGLYNFALGEVPLGELLEESDLPTLKFIPETPELIALDMRLMTLPRREHWLSERVIEPLKARFDLILIDCSPNWNQLTTNALVSSDILISPLECRINNFRNLYLFQSLIEQSRRDLRLDLPQLYLPTRSSHRRLSTDILDWYREHVSHCLKSSIRESSAGEEAMAMGQSPIEFCPDSPVADDWRRFLLELWPHLTKRNKSEHPKTDRSCDVGGKPWLSV